MVAAQVVAVHLQGVSYTYPQSGKAALSEISYTFPTGTTAIVGPNGAGKSTLVKLLTGLLLPTSGSIRAQLPGGACVPPDKLHKAVLFQEPSHLHLTVRQNITMQLEETPDEDARIYEALNIAGLGKVIKGLPEGIDTLVGAGFGGQLDLSGGQWQRLALARLIYQDAPVLILDEPVASLDPEGERAVFELFAQLTQAKIILFTTHRYDSIPKNTTIVVLKDGRITESGTHDDLLRQQQDYWSLYTAASLPVDTSASLPDDRRVRNGRRISAGQPTVTRDRWPMLTETDAACRVRGPRRPVDVTGAEGAARDGRTPVLAYPVAKRAAVAVAEMDDGQTRTACAELLAPGDAHTPAPSSNAHTPAPPSKVTPRVQLVPAPWLREGCDQRTGMSVEDRRHALVAEYQALEQRWADLHDDVTHLDQECQRLLGALTAQERRHDWIDDALLFSEMSRHALRMSSVADEALQTCNQYAMALQRALDSVAAK